jgi:hypothetical protein
MMFLTTFFLLNKGFRFDYYAHSKGESKWKRNYLKALADSTKEKVSEPEARDSSFVSVEPNLLYSQPDNTISFSFQYHQQTHNFI